MVTVYCAGGEDSEYFAVGNAGVTTSGQYRTTYARCGLQCNAVNGGGLVNYFQNKKPFVGSPSTFYDGSRCCVSNTNNQSGNSVLKSWCDINQIVRFRLYIVNVPGVFKFVKVNAAGGETQLGSTFLMSMNAGAIESLVVYINDNSSGTVIIKLNGNVVYTFSGDTTTDGVTQIAYHRLGICAVSGGTATIWSENMVLDVDPSSLTLDAFAPVANGNTHNFDTGTPAAANVNEISVNDLTLDGSTTAGQIDEYTTGAVPAGTFAVLAYGVSARMQLGASGPTKADLVVRTGGTDYFSADQVLTSAWDSYTNWWTSNPNTLAPWLTSDIGSASGFNIGIKSVT